MAANNYREQMEIMGRSAIREKFKINNSAETRLRSLFDQVSDLLKTTHDKYVIHKIRIDESDPNLLFEGITVEQSTGDRIELGVEKRGWYNGRRNHGERVLIGIVGQVEQSKGKEKFLHQQFMIEKYGQYTFIHYANSFSDSWKRVEAWPKDPKNYVRYLENLVAAGRPRARGMKR